MKKKILFLSHTDDGGAGKANVNLAKAMISLGHEVEFLVARKASGESFVKQINKHKEPVVYPTFWQRNSNRLLQKLHLYKKPSIVPTKYYVDKYYYYNEDESNSFYTLEEILATISIHPEIIIGGWISYFINLETLGKIASHFGAKPFVQMNDMAHLTGGCHYNWDCLGYTKGCENCPALGKNTDPNQSKINLSHKKNSIEKYNIQVIAGSKNNIAEAQISSLYKNQKEIKAINGIINFDLFNDKKRSIAKMVFDLPLDKKVVLSGASYINDPRKGFDKLQDSLEVLNRLLIQSNNKITYIIIGSNNNFEYNFSHIEVLKFEDISEKLLFALLYQAADVYASPSVEDTGPSMVIEALASGTPVVGYQIGFVETFVENGENGYSIQKYDTKEFAEKIYKILYHSNSTLLKQNAINSVKDAFSAKQFENFF